jgi:hypothetical protein
MTFSQLDYDNMLRRLRGSGPAGTAPDYAVECESDLHQQVRDECARRGWVCLMSSMAHRTHRTIGEPDAIIVADGGRVFFVELKAKTGKVTPEQRAMMAWLLKLGANGRVIYSLAEFIEFTR